VCWPSDLRALKENGRGQIAVQGSTSFSNPIGKEIDIACKKKTVSKNSMKKFSFFPKYQLIL
jgi:hypothetical protein